MAGALIDPVQVPGCAGLRAGQLDQRVRFDSEHPRVSTHLFHGRRVELGGQAVERAGPRVGDRDTVGRQLTHDVGQRRGVGHVDDVPTAGRPRRRPEHRVPHAIRRWGAGGIDRFADRRVGRCSIGGVAARTEGCEEHRGGGRRDPRAASPIAASAGSAQGAPLEVDRPSPFSLPEIVPHGACVDALRAGPRSAPPTSSRSSRTGGSGRRRRGRRPRPPSPVPTRRPRGRS